MTGAAVSQPLQIALTGATGFVGAHTAHELGGRGHDLRLLVRDATGEWHFNNNSGSGKNARVRIDPATDAEGTVDIWVGTRSGGTCDAEIEIKAQD